MNKKVFLKATENKIDFFNNNKIFGYVYVFDKKDFWKRNNNSTGVVCESKISPIDVVEVTNEDVILEIKKM